MKKVVISASIVSFIACVSGQMVCAKGMTTEQPAATVAVASAQVVAPVKKGKHAGYKQRHKVKGFKGHKAFAATKTAMPQARIAQGRAQPLTEMHEFGLMPKLYLTGAIGSYTIGDGQVLMPLYGNQNTAFYGLLEGRVIARDRTWFGGIGAGYRKLVSDSIYGGYVIADYNRSTQNTPFLILNPGVELLGNAWDFNLNGYIALTNSNKKTVYSGVASDFGDDSYLRYQGHTGYDHIAQRTDVESAGQGADFTVSRVLPKLEKVKVSLGGYYFWLRDNGTVRGGRIGMEYKLGNHWALEASDSYDNYNRNKFLVGVKFALGGGSASEKERSTFGLSSRLLDEVKHGYHDTIVPIKHHEGEVVISSKEELYADNLWFFHATGGQVQKTDVKATTDIGTYENPADFTFDNYTLALSGASGAINPAPVFMFASGNYSLEGFYGRLGQEYTIDVPYGCTFLGRTADFMHEAQGDDRPLFTGFWDFRSSNNVAAGSNLLSALRMQAPSANGSHKTNPVSQTAILTLNNARDVILHNDYVGDNYLTSIAMYYSSISLAGTTVRASAANIAPPISAPAETIRGILAENSAITFLSGANEVGATIEVEHLSSTNGYSVTDPIAIHATNTDIAFVDGTNNVYATTTNMDDQTVLALSVAGESSITFAGGTTTISATATGGNGGDNVFGVYAVNQEIIGARDYKLPGPVVTFAGGTNSIYAATLGEGTGQTRQNGNQVYGIYARYADVVFNHGNNSVTAEEKTGVGGNFWGVSLSDAATLTIKGGNNEITVDASTDVARDGSRKAVSIGIYGGSQADVTGGNNSIYAYNTAGADIYGFEVNSGTLDIAGGSNKVWLEFDQNPTRGGGSKLASTAYGIYADAASHLQAGNGDVSDLSSLLQHITISTESLYDGNKIEWGTKVLPWL